MDDEATAAATTATAAAATQTPRSNGTDLAAECKRLKLVIYPQVKPAVVAHPGQ